MKRIVSAILCVCCLSALSLTSCGSLLNEKSQDFVDCYNNYVKATIENSDTVVIERISETVDAKGGTLVYFTYEYTTDVGYKTSRSLYMVTSKITIDASLITLSESRESVYGDAVAKYNGKSVDKGFVAEKIHSYSKDEDMQIISLWRSVQTDRSYETEYDVDKINNSINK